MTAKAKDVMTNTSINYFPAVTWKIFQIVGNSRLLKPIYLGLFFQSC